MQTQDGQIRQIELDAETIEQIRGRLRGSLLLPSDAGYDESRSIWNGMHDRWPAFVIRPAGVADVMTAVNVAREHDLMLTIKGGGHNVAGNAVRDNALLLDMSSMRGVRVDPANRTAYAEGGALWSDFDHETSVFNLTATGGVVSTTGVAGLTLGGGVGWLNRRFGAACDNVLAFDVVLADGTFVRASAHEHADLYWALKGGGGNFGVVTGFLFQLYPFDHQVLAGARFYPVEKARDLLDFYRGFTRSASRNAVAYCVIHMNPETGANACVFAFCHSGEAAEAEREMASARSYGQADLDVIDRMPYTAWQQAFDPAFPHGRGYYWKGLLVTDLTDEILDLVARHGQQKPNPISHVAVEHYGGAYSDLGKTDTAFWHRDTQYQIVINGAWDDPSEQEQCIDWVRGLHDALAPHAATAQYLNFTYVEEAEGGSRVQASYGENFWRLVEIKSKYDPTNFFRSNNNIPPS